MHTRQISKIAINLTNYVSEHFDLCVLVTKLRIILEVTGQLGKQHCEGLPLCGVRPMMSKVKRASAEEAQAFTHTDPEVETDAVKTLEIKASLTSIPK